MSNGFWESKILGVLTGIRDLLRESRDRELKAMAAMGEQRTDMNALLAQFGTLVDDGK